MKTARWLLLPLLGSLAFGISAQPGDVSQRLKALDALLAEQWEHQLEVSPESATVMGDLRYNDRWSDVSVAHALAERRVTADFLRRFRAIDTRGLPDQARLNQQLMVRQLKEDLRSADLKLYEMPLEQMSGIQIQLPSLISSIPFGTTRQYEDYLARLRAIPTVLVQVTETARQGMRDGLMPPKFVLEKVQAQIESIAAPAGEGNTFAGPLKHFPASMSQADRQRMREAIIAAIDDQVRPAYRTLGKFVAEDYAPHGRSEPGIWQLPNGDAIYRFRIEQQTTTTQSPQTIHALGLAEVKRIEAEMSVIARSLGFPDLASFRLALKNDPKVHAASPEDLLGRYRVFVAGMEPVLPKWFDLLPKTRLTVVPFESYREKQAPPASYQQGTPDGSRAGQLYVNTGDFTHRTTMAIESIAYHEGIPGHHLQFSIAQALPGLPAFRQQAAYTAYIEGWALYAERLGKEMGFYNDPLSDYGRLSGELLRADRLVLDTGVHCKHWTRQQMIDYFHAHSSQDEPDIQAETDRYITWPGQALAYKLGQLKIVQLRERARQSLGDRFDIRAFHDQILGSGALPLGVLEDRIDTWIAAVKRGAVPARAVEHAS
jgi:uncharacterized protein (DUF885 family)